MENKKEELKFLIGVFIFTPILCLLMLYLIFGVTLTEIREFEDVEIEREYKEDKKPRYREYREFHNKAYIYGGERVHMFVPVSEKLEEGFRVSEGLEAGVYSMLYKEGNEIEVEEGDYVEIVGDIEFLPILGNVRVSNVVVKSTGDEAIESKNLYIAGQEKERQEREATKMAGHIAYLETKIEEVPRESGRESVGKVLEVEGEVVRKVTQNEYEVESSSVVYTVYIEDKYITEEIKESEGYSVLGRVVLMRGGNPGIRAYRMKKV